MPTLRTFALVCCLCCPSLVLAAEETVAPATEAPLPPAEAAGKMTLPEGFKAELFAGEPDVVQPIAMTFDDRGRLWVVECYSYPGWQPPARDRVLIFEDRDGDGRFDDRKVFWDQGSNLSGIALGFGGVWLCSIPNVVFVPDADGDDKPDGPAQIVLDGWSVLGKHNVVNDLAWGPDGWLYGCNGISARSRVGKPGTPEEDRVDINCGVWRYHPTRKNFEAVAHGTTNPWGLDFDDYGEMFITNCVIAHLWHVVPGAHFERMFGQDYDPYAYELMKTCADHIHWAGGHFSEARGGARNDAAGGGHAHSGAMIYLGDNWPATYRNRIFTCNIHGNRVNQDILERQGSGYVAHHAPDFLLANDPWFRGLAVSGAPDGSAFLIDWTDTGECHNYKVVDPTNGRIYKISYGDTKPWQGDLSKLSDDELIELQFHKNDWQVRQARRLLQERHVAGKLSDQTLKKLHDRFDRTVEWTRRLRLLWTLYSIEGWSGPQLLKLLDDSDPNVRTWAMRFQLEERQASPQLLAKLAALAADDPSPFVRQYLASGLQRLPPADRWKIAAALAAHAEDESDLNLSLMYWYAVEPLVAADPARALELAVQAKNHRLTTFIARRAVSVAGGTDKTAADVSGIAVLVRLLGAAKDPALLGDLLRGMEQAYQGRRRVEMPADWPAAFAKLSHSSQEEIRRSATALTLIFGDQQAAVALRKTAADRAVDAGQRTWAIDALVQARDSGVVGTLQGLIADRALAGVALRGLAAFDDPQTPALILNHFKQLSAADQQGAVSTLCSRGPWALQLLAAIQKGDISRRALPADQVQQLAALGDSKISSQLEQVWGAVRQSPADKKQLQEKYRGLLSAEHLKQADPSRGRAVFTRVCANCHTLFETGGKVGPDLTGAQRGNLDYLLLNVLDPSAAVAHDYQLVVIQTDSGRVLNGIVKLEDENTLTLQTATELVTLVKDEIDDRKQTTTSMMPEGLLASLSDEEARDLVSYLASPAQVPLPKASEGSAASGAARK